MNLDDFLYPEVLHQHWQMSHAERMAMVNLLERSKPKVAVEVGTYKGGSLSLISRHCESVYSIDVDQSIPGIFARYRNTKFITESSTTSLPALLRKFEDETTPLGFILIDGDHSRDGVRNDLNSVLGYRPSHRVFVLMHDSFNPQCRSGMLAAEWANAQHVSFADLDFIHGKIVQQNGPFDGQLWGGLALLILEPAIQPPVQLYATSSWMQEICSKQSLPA